MVRALVIGGGIAGTVTAIALDKAGFTPVVYEAYDRTAEGVGAFLSLAANGMNGLEALGIRDVVHGFATPRMVVQNGNSRLLGEFESPGMRTVPRSDLYVTLRDEAARRGIRIEYGKRLVDAEGPRARFADGTEAEGDLLIGADGLRSRVRRLIDPRAPEARYVGLLNTGGIARGVPVDTEPGVMHMVFGRRCFLGYVLNPDGDVWWFANPAADEVPDATPEQWRAELLRLFARDRTPARSLIEATPEIYAPWATYDFPRVPTWHRNRMIIIGDAAHAASPASGQGASMAIEDAVTLGRCLRDAADVERAFAEYESLRRERVEAVVAQGKRNGDQKAPGPVGRLLRDFFIARALKDPNRDEQRWLWDHRVEWVS
ncbi:MULTISPECIES: FAD-dependent oxidoreductase [Amycolatopsis]|uniref:2-polyprenyl-6-methoxyphenol hydroxylase n=2 Tax=Amycolatopsis TaxID=1813 RepID=A0A1I3TUP1_9PSEU|nr:NAD(P)/FAD-dependent oxidoreductase [Amycolatopsis sacchari]SFJ74988.1 2-polyprenyl-6-methoxyphenol hydroxylase [Amycolatopsis sacchari]